MSETRWTVREDGCWEWNGTRTKYGYGLARRQPGTTPTTAHRVIYEEYVGPIPDGLELDHVCHTRDTTCKGGQSCPHRCCVNPDHLEPLTPKENTYRGRSFSAINAKKTHCPKGHPYSEKNTKVSKGWRFCRTCAREAQQRYEAKKRSGRV